jgi:hypothetical protein
VGEVLALYPSGEMPVLISLDGMDERELFLTMKGELY